MPGAWSRQQASERGFASGIITGRAAASGNSGYASWPYIAAPLERSAAGRLSTRCRTPALRNSLSFASTSSAVPITKPAHQLRRHRWHRLLQRAAIVALGDKIDVASVFLAEWVLPASFCASRWRADRKDWKHSSLLLSMALASPSVRAS